MRTLRRGDEGQDVVDLQRALIAAGYDVGPARDDGDYGGRTEAAVLAFQVDRPEIPDTGIADVMTQEKLFSVVTDRPVPPAPTHPVEFVRCNDETWGHWRQFATDVCANVFYGPGRGIWDPKRRALVVTYAPGRYSKPSDLQTWRNRLGKLFPAFHCTSFTNVVLSLLDRRNDTFTHAGNIPQLHDLMTMDSSVHQIKDAGAVRGFSDVVSFIRPNGTGEKRLAAKGYRRPAGFVDMRELFERRKELTTFLVFEQSSLLQSGWLELHHTGVFTFRDGVMTRIAADGRYDKTGSGYSAQAMREVEITEKNIALYANAAYRCWGVDTFDGAYGNRSRPFTKVEFEAFPK